MISAETNIRNEIILNFYLDRLLRLPLATICRGFIFWHQQFLLWCLTQAVTLIFWLVGGRYRDQWFGLSTRNVIPDVYCKFS